MNRLTPIFAAASAVAVGSCSPQAPSPSSPPQTTQPQAAQHAASPPSAGVSAPGLSANAIDAAAPPPAAAHPPAPDPAAPPDPALIRAEVLLDRAGFSPGVIDGHAGSNETRALQAFQRQAGLPASGQLDPDAWRALTRDGHPVVQSYTIAAQDVAGPFAPDVGEDFVKLAALPQGPLYGSPLEALAERFHMSQPLLKALNPGADFAKAGTAILVAAPDAPAFAKGQVARIAVSKVKEQVFAFDAGGRLLAVYPATVGSTDRPSPSGRRKVRGVAYDPHYVYDPAKLHWGPRKHGRLVIKPGPKGPVGVAWIGLNAPGYGLHGSPDASLIGKTASHGCVRLTNWDARALAHGVKPGVEVDFSG
jgi:lipoprotein-anchoring transpeptidase ErfK/SrfK